MATPSTVEFKEQLHKPGQYGCQRKSNPWHGYIP